MAGSKPMCTEAGSGLPIAQAFSRKTPMCRPRLKLTLSVSGPWTHMRWMVTSETPVSGSSAAQQAQVEEGAGVLGRALELRDECAQVEGGLDHHFLAGRRTLGDDHRRHRSFQGREQVEGQPFR